MDTFVIRLLNCGTSLSRCVAGGGNTSLVNLFDANITDSTDNVVGDAQVL